MAEVSKSLVESRLLPALKEDLPPKDYAALEKVASKLDPDSKCAELAACLVSIYGQADEKALQSFRLLRSRLKAASKGLNRLQVSVDTKLKDPPQNRLCWFTADQLASRVASGEDLDRLIAGHDPSLVIRSTGIRTTVEDLVQGKRRVKIGVAFASADRSLAKDLLDSLKTQLESLERLVVEWVDFPDVGAHLPSHLDKILTADLVLVLISPSLLGWDNFEELESLRRSVPIHLSTTRRDLHDIRWLKEVAWFCEVKAWSLLTRREKQTESVSLAETIVRRLETSSPGSLSLEFVPELPSNLYTRALGQKMSHIPESEQEFAQLSGKGQDALEHLNDWANDPTSSAYGIVLGEFGIGKTTLLQQFVSRWNEAIKEGIDRPQAIYVDLRLHDSSISEGKVPHLEEFLTESLKRGWAGKKAELSAKEILRLVRTERAILIFDGLDEKLVHLGPQEGKSFLRELWSALPPATIESELRDPLQGRLLFSCRSHFFASLNEQASMFTAQRTRGMKVEDYMCLILLPFSEAQIREYIGKVLGSNEIDETLDMIKSIHNLMDLSTRPYLLSLITGQIKQLERMREGGRTVTSIDLYRNMVRDALERDTGKHQLTKRDKERLMRRLAHAMWADGAREWPWGRVEDWLVEQLNDSSFRYPNVKTEILAEDFRTATFVLRPDRSQEDFRFAHTSLQEFFFAEFLAEALDGANPIEAWSVPLPSDETLAFLGEILNREKTQTRCAVLENMLERYHRRASEAIFRYGIIAQTRSLPTPKPPVWNLEGADLRGWKILGGKETHLSFFNLRLRRADLQESVWHRVAMPNGNLSEAEASRSEWIDIDLSQADLSGITAVASVWRWVLAEDAVVAAQTPHSWEQATWVYGTPPSRFLVGEGPTQITYAEASNKSEGQTITLANGHTSFIASCAFSPDGNFALSASYDETLILWEVQTGKPIQNYRGHTSPITSCAFSPDGNFALSAAGDQNLILWEVQTGKPIQTYQGHKSRVTSCAFSPDGNFALSASYDQTLILWEVQTGKPIQNYRGHTSPITSCAFSPDGNFALSAAGDQNLILWEVQTGKPIQTYQGHKSRVTSCAFSPDGNFALSASYDQTLILWEVQTGKPIQNYRGHKGAVTSCAFSPDGNFALSAAGDQNLILWEVQTGKPIQTYQGYKGTVTSCAFSPDGNFALSAAGDQNLILWEVQTGKLIQTYKGHTGVVTSCAFSPDGNFVLSASYDETLILWEVQTGKPIQTYQGHKSRVTSCAFSPDGNFALSASYDQTLILWEVQTGKPIQNYRGHKGAVTSCAFSPDGNFALSAAGDQNLILWEVQTGKLIQTYQGYKGAVTSCAFSPDGNFALSASYDETLILWEVQTGKPIQTYKGHTGEVTSCAFSPDGNFALSASRDQTLILWEVQTGKLIQTYKGHTGGVTSCAFSPDGNFALSASRDQTLILWEVQTGKLIQTYKGHTGGVTSCAFSPDGNFALSASRDQTHILWEVHTGKAVRRWSGEAGPRHWSYDFQSSRWDELGEEAWRRIHWVVTSKDGQLMSAPPEAFGMEAILQTRPS